MQLEKHKVNNNPPENYSEVITSIDDEMAGTLEVIRKNKYERELRQLEDHKNNKERAAAVFSLKDKILGSKKISQDRVVLTDPETGREVYRPEDIKRVSLNYLVNILKTKEPEVKYAELIHNRKVVHFERMEERIEKK